MDSPPADPPVVADSSAPLQPWEQHGGIIHMPRYLYSSHAAPLLHRSGFLITCAFQREKSATKEAMEILHEFLDITKAGDKEPDAKRARTGAYSRSTNFKLPDVTKSQEEIEGIASQEEKVPIASQEEKVPIASQEEKETVARQEETGAVASQEETGAVASQEETGAAVGEGEEQSPSVEVQGTDDNNAKRNGSEVDSIGESKQHDFQLVKLARNGMVYISIPSRSPGDLVKFVDSLLKEFHTKSRAAPRWCHRIFPVQATCVWSYEEVRSTVVLLVKEFIKGRTISSTNPLKYAVAVNRRGLEEKSEPAAASFGKVECINAVGEAIRSHTSDISVNLTDPQMVVILEVLPLVRVETAVCAVSVLPRELVVTKPKLVIQALAPPKT